MGLSAREAARQLKVSHVTLLDWESEARNPSKDYRKAISRWSGGGVPEASWPLSKRELARAARLESVQPSAVESRS